MILEKFILNTIFFLSALATLGQSSANCEINLRVENRAYYRQFFINLKRDQNLVLIEYKIRVKENSEEREKDTNTIKVRQDFLKIKNVTPQNDSLLKVLDALDSLYLAYTTYRVDTLQLSTKYFPEFNKIIDNLLITPTDSLENNGQIYLDGTSFTFKINTQNEQRTVYANSVDKNNHPQLAEFVASVMQLYRDRKRNDFLDRKSTAGY
jgi:hypothetical protein